jgi:hypothetical protein
MKQDYSCPKSLVSAPRTVRYDWLAHYWFDSIEEVQDYATQWL